MTNAACYLRSSKDRSDVSIAAQRHELEKLAVSRSLTVVKSFEDAVESGSTEDRPAFIELVRAIKDPGRGWDALLVYDTSRIARRRYIAQAIKHEAKKRGVVIHYAKLPADLDPIAELVLESVFEAMDEAHSLMSREKGLAGMAENVRRGWRAGGRAPLGYVLETTTTGAVREGKPVTKSKLALGAAAKDVALYLRARSTGEPRAHVLRRVLHRKENSMIGVEWNALTYAGHTVWNVHAEQGSGRKRRPRAQWHITRDTHPALITDAEAEAILAQLETSSISASMSRAKAAMSSHLLTGFLYTDDGQMWVGQGDRYRLKRRNGRPGKTVLSSAVDAAVIGQVRKDMGSEKFLAKWITAAGKRRADPAVDIETRIAKLEREKARAAQLALTEDATTFLQLVADRARQIEALRHEVNTIRTETVMAGQLAALTVPKLKALLAEQDPAKAIQSLVERIILNHTLECRICYRAAPGRARWLPLASPEGFERWPHELTAPLLLYGAA